MIIIHMMPYVQCTNNCKEREARACAAVTPFCDPSTAAVLCQEVLESDASLRERVRRVWALWQVIDSGPIAKWVARAMVASYYCNLVGVDTHIGTYN